MTDNYYAVIFSRTTGSDTAGYDELAENMLALARKQPGFIGFNSASENNFGIAVSYWKDMQSIKNWQANAEHLQAQKLGRERFYSDFSLQICRVEKSYAFNSPDYHPEP